jgi:hypothetical protein
MGSAVRAELERVLRVQVNSRHCEHDILGTAGVVHRVTVSACSGRLSERFTLWLDPVRLRFGNGDVMLAASFDALARFGQPGAQRSVGLLRGLDQSDILPPELCQSSAFWVVFSSVPDGLEA